MTEDWTWDTAAVRHVRTQVLAIPKLSAVSGRPAFAGLSLGPQFPGHMPIDSTPWHSVIPASDPRLSTHLSWRQDFAKLPRRTTRNGDTASERICIHVMQRILCLRAVRSARWEARVGRKSEEEEEEEDTKESQL